MLQPYLSFMEHHQSKVAPVTEAELLAELKLEYEKLPDAIRSLLSFDDFLQQRDKFEAGIRSKILQQRQHHSEHGYSEARVNQTGHLRLFDSATLEHGWQLSTEPYSGVCLELKQSAQCFIGQQGSPALLRSVTYGAAHDTQPTAENPVPGVFYDAQENASNGEWRYIRPISKGAVVKLAKGDVVGIYVSIHTPVDVVASLRDLIALDLRYRGCGLYEVYPDASTWRLTARPI